MKDRFSLLFNRFVSNACSREEYNELLQLMGRPEYDELLKEEIARHFSRDLEGTGKGMPHVDGILRIAQASAEIPRKHRIPARRRLYLAGAAAAAVATVLLVPYLFKTDSPQRPVVHAVAQKSTTRAETKHIYLPDSTEVWLNAASVLEFPDVFKTGRREVTLTGEAFFDVRHADKVPFIIHTGQVTTTVLGTAFNIKAYPGQSGITVSVTRGKVSVANAGGEAKTLIKGQQVKIDRKDDFVVSREVAPEKVAAWQNGDLFYDDVALGDILDDLKNTHAVEIAVQDSALKDIRLTAAFQRRLSIGKVMAIISRLTDVTVSKTGDNYYEITQNKEP